MNTISKPPIYRVFIWQALVTLLLTSTIFVLGRVQGYSFFAGCLIQLTGNLYFARLAFRYSGARQVNSMVQSMYRGEAGKIVLTAVLFAMVFAVVRPLSAVSVFAGYLAMQLLYIALSARLLKRTTF